jgi:5-methylcytosine-specific restriction endonuclease McrBC regulatory subunit McrC
MHRRYETLRRLCLMILKRRGQDPFHSDGSRVSGILIVMSRTWELLLEKTLGLPGQRTTHILSGRRSVKPDLPLAGGVLDAKYKKIWEDVYLEELSKSENRPQPKGKKSRWNNATVRADVYQILSYIYLFQFNNGGTVFPVSKRQAGRAFSLTVLEGMPGDPHFWLIPLPIPDDAADQWEFDCRMDENLRQLRKLLDSWIAAEPEV